MNSLLGLWLKNVPENTVIFTQPLLIDVMIDSISYNLGIGIQATGRIKWYQIIIGGLLMLNLPVSWILLALGFVPTSVFIVGIVITFIAFICRLFFLKYLLDFRFTETFVLKNLGFICFSCGCILPVLLIIHKLFIAKFFIITLCLEYITEFILILFTGFTNKERQKGFNFLKGKIYVRKTI